MILSAFELLSNRPIITSARRYNAQSSLLVIWLVSLLTFLCVLSQSRSPIFMKFGTDVQHNYVDPASIYRILPQIRPDPDQSRIQIHWIRMDPHLTRIHQIHRISDRIWHG